MMMLSLGEYNVCWSKGKENYKGIICSLFFIPSWASLPRFVDWIANQCSRQVRNFFTWKKTFFPSLFTHRLHPHFLEEQSVCLHLFLRWVNSFSSGWVIHCRQVLVLSFWIICYTKKGGRRRDDQDLCFFQELVIITKHSVWEKRSLEKIAMKRVEKKHDLHLKEKWVQEEEGVWATTKQPDLSSLFLSNFLFLILMQRIKTASQEQEPLTRVSVSKKSRWWRKVSERKRDPWQWS